MRRLIEKISLHIWENKIKKQERLNQERLKTEKEAILTELHSHIVEQIKGTNFKIKRTDDDIKVDGPDGHILSVYMHPTVLSGGKTDAHSIGISEGQFFHHQTIPIQPNLNGTHPLNTVPKAKQKLTEIIRKAVSDRA